MDVFKFIEECLDAISRHIPHEVDARYEKLMEVVIRLSPRLLDTCKKMSNHNPEKATEQTEVKHTTMPFKHVRSDKRRKNSKRKRRKCTHKNLSGKKT